MSTSPAPAPAAPSKNKFLGFVEAAGEKVVHVVEDIGKVSVDAVKIIETGKEITPEVKAAFAIVFEDGQSLATLALPAVNADGLNLVEDSALVTELVKFVKDFIAQIPVLKAAVAKIEADIQ